MCECDQVIHHTVYSQVAQTHERTGQFTILQRRRTFRRRSDRLQVIEVYDESARRHVATLSRSASRVISSHPRHRVFAVAISITSLLIGEGSKNLQSAA